MLCIPLVLTQASGQWVPVVNGRGTGLTSHFDLLSRVRMSGGHTFTPQRVQGQFYLLLLSVNNKTFICVAALFSVEM
jgi:hypothetical protein